MAGQFAKFARLADAVRERLFAENVFTALHERATERGVPVIGGRNEDAIVLGGVIDELAVITVGLGARGEFAADFEGIGLREFDLRRVDIAERDQRGT